MLMVILEEELTSQPNPSDHGSDGGGSKWLALSSVL